MTFALYLGQFVLVSFASRSIGTLLTRFHLPLISGYLLVGIIVGPFVLNMIPTEAIQQLRFVDEIALAIIAFAAGSEMFLEELQGRLRSILWNTVAQLVVVYLIGGIAFFFLIDSIPFFSNLSSEGRFAAALLAGVILVARSPSSALAIINELRAKGAFTKTVLGVTLVKDVIVVALFALATSVASALLSVESFDVGFLVLVTFELALSFLAGYFVGRLLASILSLRFDERVKIILIILVGWAVFVLSDVLRDYTHDYLDFEILLEPLLICMVASFWLTNRSIYRSEFRHLLHQIEPPVYIAFFTLIGVSLALDTLALVLPVTLALFAARIIALIIGGLAGGSIAGDPPQYNRLSWMAYITQAGVGLGLAKEAAIEFPVLGDNFATLLIAVIVISQLVGPPFFKIAIKRVGEAHTKGEAHPDEVRDALILGVEAQSLALARRLEAHNWKVIMADTDEEHVQEVPEDGIEIRYISDVTVESLSSLITSSTDAIVAALDDDIENLTACEIAFEHFGTPRLIVRLNDFAWADKFTELNVTVLYPTMAMVSLLDEAVRAPQSAALLLHTDPDHDVTQITISDVDIDGLAIRDVRMPDDVVVLGIMRNTQSIVPHGYTVLHLDDEITLVGSPRSLEEVTRRLGY